jgi:hypothetical protein
MPSYPGIAQATLLRDNQQKYFWNAETVATGTLSVAFELARVSRSHYPWGLSVEAIFAAPPGAFEIDIMGSNNDNYPNYVQLGNITSVLSLTGLVGRWDMPTNMWPKYIACYLKTLTVASLVTVQVTR